MMDLGSFRRVFSVLGTGFAACPLTLLGAFAVIFSPNHVSASEDCTSYFNISGDLIPGETCDDYCCGTSYNKYCCSNCSLSISLSDSCSGEEWDPTSTIIQGVFIAFWFIIILLVWGLQSNGCLDTGKCPKKRKRMPGPPAKKSYDGAYPKQIIMPSQLPPDPQSMQLTSENPHQDSALPFSRAQSEAGSDPEDIPPLNPGYNHSDAAVLQIDDTLSHDRGPLISHPPTFDGETLHSVEVHPEPGSRKDYGSTEQIIPLGRRETGSYEHNNEAFVETPQHVPKHPGRLPPVDQNRTETPSSVVLAVRPSPEPVDLEVHYNQIT